LPWLARQWGFRPFVGLAVGMIAGVVLAERLALSFSWALLVACLAAAALVGAVAQLAGGLRLALALFFLPGGVVLHSLHSVVPTTHLSRVLPLESVWLQGRLTAAPQALTSGQRLLLAVEARGDADQWLPACGTVSLYQDSPTPGLRCGDSLQVRVDHLEEPPRPRNPGEFDARRFNLRRGICAEGTVAALRPGPPAALTGRDRLSRWSVERQGRALEVLTATMPGSDPEYWAGLLGGMVFGQRAAGGVDPATAQVFRRSGTMHLLVVSGAQISFLLVVLVALLTGRGRVLAAWQLAVLLPALVLFTIFAGPGASVWRALIMGGLLAFSMVSARRYDAYSALGLAALVLIIADTNVVFDLGAQLTFAAALGVILMIPRAAPDPRTGRLRRPRLPAVVAWASAGAWACTTPLLVSAFSGLPLFGNLANLIAVPISMLVLPLGMVALLLGAWLPSVAVVTCGLSRVLLTVMMAVSGVCSRLPGAYCDLVHFSPAQVVGWYMGVAGGVLLLARADLRRPALRWWRAQSADRRWLCGGAALGIAVVAAALSLARPPQLTVEVMSVGAGNAILVQSPSGGAVLMDAGTRLAGSGERLAGELLVPALARRGVRRLDAVVLTHPDADHYSALAPLLERVPVGEFLTPALPDSPAAGYARLRRTLAARRIAVRPAWAGQALDLGGGAQALLLAPSVPLVASPDSFTNDNSAVLLLRYGQTQVLLLGDQQAAGLERLLTWAQAQGLSLASSAILLPHHGRSARWCGALLSAAQPQWILVSAESSTYARTGLAGSAAASVPLLCTADQGCLTLTSNGREVRVGTYAP
jgi:competence protein ComEC